MIKMVVLGLLATAFQPAEALPNKGQKLLSEKILPIVDNRFAV